MEFAIKKVAGPTRGAILHVALIRPDDSVEVHEKLPAARAADRYRMLCLQVELYDQEGKPGYRAYMGEEWPIPEAAA